MYALLSQFVAKPMHQLDEFYFIAKQADVELSAHLQLLNFDDMSFEQCYFVDYVPDLLLKMLFQCVLQEPTFTLLLAFQINCYSHFFKNIILKIKDKQALTRVCTEGAGEALRAVTGPEFVKILAKTLRVYYGQNC